MSRPQGFACCNAAYNISVIFEMVVQWTIVILGYGNYANMRKAAYATHMQPKFPELTRLHLTRRPSLMPHTMRKQVATYIYASAE